MRIEVIGNGLEVSDVLRTYAESRVWLAVQRAADQLSWVGVRLMSENGDASVGRVVAQLDVWLRGIGLVTVRHIDINAYVGIDSAAVRLEQAVVRKLREAGRYTVAGSDRAIIERQPAASSSRYAVVIVPTDARPRLSLVPWLRTRYGIDSVETVALSWPEWDALVAGELDAPHLKRIKDRLALALLRRPQAMVVVGGAVPQGSRDERSQSRPEVERVANNIRLLGLPIEVIGVWVNEQWTADDSLVESEEVPLQTEHADASDSDEEMYAALSSD